jgi:hypothetical protein
MKILGRKGKNFILEVTPKEMETFRIALFEWQEVENCTSVPVKSFGRLLDRIYTAVHHFNNLPVIKAKALPKPFKVIEGKNENS